MPDILLEIWSLYVFPFLESYWPIIISLILIAFAVRGSGAVHPYADLSQSLSRTALEALKDTFDQIGTSLRLDSPDYHAQTISKRLSGVLEDFFTRADRILKTSMGAIKNHAKDVIEVFGTDNNDRVWKIAGAMITACLLGVFVLADVIQAANNLGETRGFSFITRELIRAYPILDNLPLSIMISSVGTTATLGFVLLDLWGITKFIPWENAEAQGRPPIIRRLKFWVVIFLFMTILVSALFATSRLQVLRFNSTIANDLVALAPMLAQVLILIPMLATTVFLSYGVMVVYIIYLIALGLIQLLLFGIRTLFYVLKGLLSVAEYTGTPAVGLFLAIFLGVIIILGRMTGLVLMVFDSAFVLVEFAFLTVFGMFRWILGLVGRRTIS